MGHYRGPLFWIFRCWLADRLLSLAQRVIDPDTRRVCHEENGDGTISFYEVPQ